MPPRTTFSVYELVQLGRLQCADLPLAVCVTAGKIAGHGGRLFANQQSAPTLDVAPDSLRASDVGHERLEFGAYCRVLHVYLVHVEFFAASVAMLQAVSRIKSAEDGANAGVADVDALEEAFRGALRKQYGKAVKSAFAASPAYHGVIKEAALKMGKALVGAVGGGRVKKGDLVAGMWYAFAFLVCTSEGAV